MTEKGEKRTDEIIEAAINEFVEKGYTNASMESIAIRANLSKGGLYHHFKSKTEILYAVNLKFTEPIIGLMSEIENSKSLIEGFSMFIDKYLNYWVNHTRELNLYFATMNESFSNPQIMDLYRDSIKQEVDYFEEMFKLGQQHGLFREGDARSHALALISCLDGFLGYILIDPAIPVENVKKEIQNIFITNFQK